MADYFTNFSLVLDLPDQAAQTYALETARDAAEWRDTDEVPPDFPASLKDVLEFWLFETEAEDSPGSWGIWLHSSNGGIDAVCEFIQHLLRKFKLTDVVGFEWSNDCSKPRTDAYGGGAAIITARKITSMNTGEWLQRQVTRHQKTRSRVNDSATRPKHPTP